MNNQVVKCICDNKFDLSNWITLAVSIINLGFVIWFYFNDKKQKKKENLNSYKMSWYRSFDFKDNILSLDSIFTKARNNLNNITNSKETDIVKLKQQAKKCIEEFNEELLKEKKKMVSILNCIDKENGILLANKYNVVQDDFLNLVQKSIINFDQKNISVDSELIKMKSIIISCMYEIGLQFI